MKWKLDEISTQTWIVLAALFVLALILVLIGHKKNKWNPLMLSNGALCIALSFVLSYIRLFKMPQGGSVTPASLLPVMAFSYLYGVIPGLLVGVCYGVLQLIQNPEIVGLAQALLDYPLAFGSIALAGFGHVLIRDAKPGSIKELGGWLIGMALASAARYVCHSLSGYLFFAEYAAGSGLSPLVYTLAYNSYVLVDAALCAVIVCIPQIRSALNRVVKMGKAAR